MNKEEYVYCFCGSKVPFDLAAAHLTEHDLNLTSEMVLNAPVIDLTESEEAEKNEPTKNEATSTTTAKVPISRRRHSSNWATVYRFARWYYSMARRRLR